MKSLKAALAVLLLSPAAPTFAAVQTFPVNHRVVFVDERGSRTEPQTRPSLFRLEVLGDNDGYKGETLKNGRPFINAKNGESYSLRVYNPLPVTVAVNLTVDGLNTISGKPSGIADGEKWLIEPYGFIVIRGWQVNGEESRRFFFTEKPKSYAKWRGDVSGMNLSANCGVIGAAFFWSQVELDAYYASHPVYRFAYNLKRDYGVAAVRGKAARGEFNAAASMGSAEDSAPAAPAARQAELKAGTGMGERETSVVSRVDFKYDTGMYAASQALLVYYDFPTPQSQPNPFPGVAYAPEMP
jgi:hypothetical protein